MSDAPQGSVAWMKNRMGNLTGSRIYDACAKGKGGKYYASRDTLMTEQLIERLTDPAVSPGRYGPFHAPRYIGRFVISMF